MKLYRNLVNAVAETLSEIFTKNRYADKALEKLFKQNPKWGSRDRRFVAESVYDIVRYYRFYSELADTKNNFWFITAVYLVEKGIELPEWQEFKHVDPAYIFKKKNLISGDKMVRESYPNWLWNYGAAELGEEAWETEASAMNEPAPVVLRVNTIKTTESSLKEELQKQEIIIKKIEELKSAYILEKRENVFRNNLFKEGWFEIQDAGSQQISEFVNPSEKDLVIDACAGAGGKSLHLAALMKNKGKIISMDVEAWKLDELKKRARRAGAFNIETKLIEENKTVKLFSKRADKLLLDVPCSGSGVIKRNPDAKWKLNEEIIEKTILLQKDILKHYSEMVKPGGSLIYGTCSIFPSENEKQIEYFMQIRPEFTFVQEKRILPSEGFDGFYMCELKRNQ
jgi:16S rRNA (cytosine967-C5)-methyltransferase